MLRNRRQNQKQKIRRPLSSKKLKKNKCKSKNKLLREHRTAIRFNLCSRPKNSHLKGLADPEPKKLIKKLHKLHKLKRQNRNNWEKRRKNKQLREYLLQKGKTETKEISNRLNKKRKINLNQIKNHKKRM
jgi:hypothetical protein